MSPRGILAAGTVESAEAGASALRAGGNAVDAAVAAAVATSVGEPAITSLAGGGALIFYDARQRAAEVLDFFASAPGLGGRRSPDEVSADGLPPLDFKSVELTFPEGGSTQTFHVGRGAAAVPGALKGLCAASERWGRLPLAKVLAPTVDRLRRGVEQGPYQIQCVRTLVPILELFELGRTLAFDERGRRVEVGATFRNPRLADALEELGRVGLERFYGDIFSPAVVGAFGEAHGGWITEMDMARWRPAVREPLAFTRNGCRILSNPAPSFGGRLIAHTLDLFERCGLDETDSESSERLRRLTAVFRAVSEVRAENPEILSGPDAAATFFRRLEEIICDARSSSRQRERRTPGNTTHVSVIDSEGNAVGVSLSHGEGNGYEIPGTGIFMNNLLGEEDLFPHGFHRFIPGERLSTMMAPTIIERADGGLYVLGSGGSNRIRTALAQVIWSIVVDGLDPAPAVSRGRLHFENGVLSAETYALPGGRDALSRALSLATEVREFTAPSLFFGGVHLAWRSPSGELFAHGDQRRGGIVRCV